MHTSNKKGRAGAPIFISVTISAMKALNVIFIPSPGPSRNYSAKKRFVTNTWKPCLLWSWESHKPQTNPATSVALSLLYCRAFVCAPLSGLFKAALYWQQRNRFTQLWCNQLNFLFLFISFFFFFLLICLFLCLSSVVSCAHSQNMALCSALCPRWLPTR